VHRSTQPRTSLDNEALQVAGVLPHEIGNRLIVRRCLRSEREVARDLCASDRASRSSARLAVSEAPRTYASGLGREGSLSVS